MKGKGFDWKFFSTILVAIAGLGIPIFFWQADLTAHSLSVRLISSSALQAPAGSGIQDLKIMVNGTAIESSFISSLTLSNTGSKPIASADFETPLELISRNKSALISAQIAKSVPEDIPAKVVVAADRLQILPFLSNPKDEVTITVVSSGQPDFSAKARISGVKEVAYEDMTEAKKTVGSAIFAAALSLIGFAIYVFFMLSGKFSSPSIVSPGIKMITALWAAITASAISERFTTLLGDTPTALAVSIGFLIVGGALGLVLAIRARRKNYQTTLRP